MKNNSTVLTTVQDIINRLKQELDTVCKKYIETEVRHAGSTYGAQNVPTLEDESLEQYVIGIRSFFMNRLTDISLSLQGTIQNQLGVMNRYSVEQKITEIKKQIDNLTQEINQLKSSLGRLQLNKDKERHKRDQMLINIIAVIESIGYAATFMRLGDSIIFACIYGLLIGLASTLGIKSLILYLRDHHKTQLSKGAKIAIGVISCLVIWALASIRFMYIQKGTGTGAGLSALGILPFIVITFLLIALVAGLTYIYYPSQDDLFKISEHDRLEGEIRKRQDEIKGLNKNVEELNAEINTINQVHTQLENAEKDFDKRINAYWGEAQGEFKLANRVARPDNSTPKCFNAPLAPIRRIVDGSDNSKSEGI